MGKGTTKPMVYQYLIDNGLYEDYLNFAASNLFTNGLSYLNSALVICQRPGAVCVHTENRWYRDYGRTIRPGATPIVIVQPGGPVSFQYDIADTVGEEAPKIYRAVLNRKEIRTPVGERYDDLRRAAVKNGFYFSEKPFGLRQGGMSAVSSEFLPAEYKGKPFKTHYSITLNSSANDSRKAETILHELGHIYCGHLQSDEKHMKELGIPKRELKSCTADMKEYEAEKVCELVCRTLGFEYDSGEYLSGYDTENIDEAFSLSYIADAAEKIIRGMMSVGIIPVLEAADYEKK